MITNMVPYFRICAHDFRQRGSCNSETGYWRLPISELFIRSATDDAGCLPRGEIAYAPGFDDQYLLPRLNTMSQWMYPLSDPNVPVDQDAQTCYSYIDPLSTPTTIEQMAQGTGGPTLIPAASDGLPEARVDFNPDVECQYSTNDPTNEQRQFYLQALAEELNFEVVSDDEFITTPDDVLGQFDPVGDTSDRNDLMFGEGGGSGNAPTICDGDEIIGFAVSSVGVKSLQIGSDRVTNMRHRILLHIRQSYDPTDVCASELCFNTLSLIHI